MRDYMDFGGGVIAAVVVLVAFIAGIVIDGKSTAQLCKQAGVFTVGDQTFECKAKP